MWIHISHFRKVAIAFKSPKIFQNAFLQMEDREIKESLKNFIYLYGMDQILIQMYQEILF